MVSMSEHVTYLVILLQRRIVAGPGDRLKAAQDVSGHPTH